MWCGVGSWLLLLVVFFYFIVGVCWTMWTWSEGWTSGIGGIDATVEAKHGVELSKVIVDAVRTLLARCIKRRMDSTKISCCSGLVSS